MQWVMIGSFLECLASCECANDFNHLGYGQLMWKYSTTHAENKGFHPATDTSFSRALVQKRLLGIDADCGHELYTRGFGFILRPCDYSEERWSIFRKLRPFSFRTQFAGLSSKCTSLHILQGSDEIENIEFHTPSRNVVSYFVNDSQPRF